MVKKNRIVFVDYLRTFACLFVVYSHLCENFWFINHDVAKESLFKTFNHMPSFLLITYSWRLYNINFGIIGIGIFFLLTGFLAPFSYENRSYIQYIKIRFYRIYPIFFIGTIFTAILLFINSRLNHLNYPFNFTDVGTNLLLVNDLFRNNPFDMIIWTLLIQIKFYILSFIFLKGRYLKAKVHIIFTLTWLFVTIIAANFLKNLPQQNLLYYPVQTLSYIGIYLIFITLGICFHNTLFRKWSIGKSSIVILVTYSLLLLAIEYGRTFGFKRTVAIDLSLAIIIFIFFYKVGFYLKQSSVANFLASRSYAIYIIHRINGYIGLNWLLLLGLSPLASLAVIIVLIFISANLLFIFVEKPIYGLVKKDKFK